MVSKIVIPKTTPLLSFDPNINFWILRAEGGKYYDDFIDDNYIGIRYNKVTISDLVTLQNKSDIVISENVVRDLYREKYDPLGEKEMDRSTKQRLTQHAKQTYMFMFGMKDGDVVFVPSKRSEYFAVGFINGDPYDENPKRIQARKKHAPENGLNFAISNYVKRRKICWVSTIRREELPFFLSWTINAHQAIMPVKFEHEGLKVKLMGIVFPLFEFKNQIYLKVYTGKGNSLSLTDWSLLINANNKDNINLKADVNSPGYLTFSTDLNNWRMLVNLVQQLWDIIPSKNCIVDWFIIRSVVYFIFGSDIKKMGVIKWFQEARSRHLDNQLKEIEVEEKKVAKGSVAEKLDLRIIQSGTAIQNAHRTTLKDNDDDDHIAEK